MSLKAVLWTVGGIAALAAAAYGVDRYLDSKKNNSGNDGNDKEPSIIPPTSSPNITAPELPHQPVDTKLEAFIKSLRETQGEIANATLSNTHSASIGVPAVTTRKPEPTRDIHEDVKAFIVSGFRNAMPLGMDTDVFLQPHQKALDKIAVELAPTYVEMNVSEGNTKAFSAKAVSVMTQLAETDEDVRRLDVAMQNVDMSGASQRQKPTVEALKPTLDDIVARHPEAIERIKKSFRALAGSNMSQSAKVTMAQNAFESFTSKDRGVIALLSDIMDNNIPEQEIRAFFGSIFAVLHERKETVAE